MYLKQKRVIFSKNSVRVKPRNLELIYTDIWGFTLVQLIDRSSYFIAFINDYTRKIRVYFLKHKLNVFDVFKKWRVLVENET